MPLQLDPQQREKLCKALLNAFDLEGLEMLVTYSLDSKLDVLARQGTLDYRIYSLIENTQARGWLEKLIKGAIEKQPDNPELQKFVQCLPPGWSTSEDEQRPQGRQHYWLYGLAGIAAVGAVTLVAKQLIDEEETLAGPALNNSKRLGLDRLQAVVVFAREGERLPPSELKVLSPQGFNPVAAPDRAFFLPSRDSASIELSAAWLGHVSCKRSKDFVLEIRNVATADENLGLHGLEADAASWAPESGADVRPVAGKKGRSAWLCLPKGTQLEAVTITLANAPDAGAKISFHQQGPKSVTVRLSTGQRLGVLTHLLNPEWPEWEIGPVEATDTVKVKCQKNSLSMWQSESGDLWLARSSLKPGTDPRGQRVDLTCDPGDHERNAVLDRPRAKLTMVGDGPIDAPTVRCRRLADSSYKTFQGTECPGGYVGL